MLLPEPLPEAEGAVGFAEVECWVDAGERPVAGEADRVLHRRYRLPNGEVVEIGDDVATTDGTAPARVVGLHERGDGTKEAVLRYWVAAAAEQYFKNNPEDQLHPAEVLFDPEAAAEPHPVGVIDHTVTVRTLLDEELTINEEEEAYPDPPPQRAMAPLTWCCPGCFLSAPRRYFVARLWEAELGMPGDPLDPEAGLPRKEELAKMCGAAVAGTGGGGSYFKSIAAGAGEEETAEATAAGGEEEEEVEEEEDDDDDDEEQQQQEEEEAAAVPRVEEEEADPKKYILELAAAAAGGGPACLDMLKKLEPVFGVPLFLQEKPQEGLQQEEEEERHPHPPPPPLDPGTPPGKGKLCPPSQQPEHSSPLPNAAASAVTGAGTTTPCVDNIVAAIARAPPPPPPPHPAASGATAARLSSINASLAVLFDRRQRRVTVSPPPPPKRCRHTLDAAGANA